MIRDIHSDSMANALPSTGLHPETAFLIQQKHLTPQNKMLAPHCGKMSETPLVNDQLSGVSTVPNTEESIIIIVTIEDPMKKSIVPPITFSSAMSNALQEHHIYVNNHPS